MRGLGPGRERPKLGQTWAPAQLPASAAVGPGTSVSLLTGPGIPPTLPGCDCWSVPNPRDFPPLLPAPHLGSQCAAPTISLLWLTPRSLLPKAADSTEKCTLWPP